MRRLIVIVLLLILPTQVLAESLEDLRATSRHALLIEAVKVASVSTDTTSERPSLPGEAFDSQSTPAHADISDSVNHTSALYTYSLLSAGIWPRYRPITFQSIYLPVIKPPLI